MRDWRDSDPAYAPNDASHPRNRPAGAPAVVEPAPESAARLVAVMRAYAAAQRPAPPRPGRRQGGNPAAGHRASLAEKQAAHERYERLRARFRGELGRPVMNELEREWLDAYAAREASRVCRYW